MHWIAIRQKLRERAAQGDERALYVARRVNRHLKKQVRRAKGLGAAKAPVPVEDTPHYNILLKALDAGKKIVAFDAEWHPQRPTTVPITELGVTIYGPTSLECFNICTRPGGKKFRHGTTRFMTDEQARKWLSKTLEGTGLIIGHSFKNDRLQLARWNFTVPKIELLDTASWSKMLFPPNAQSLKGLAIRYGVDPSGWHCAGNDSRITMLVALAMAGIKHDDHAS